MNEGLLEVLDPTSEPEARRGALSPRLDTLSGKTLGVIWNGRLPGDQILHQATSMLEQEYGVEAVVIRQKPFIGNVAPEEIFNDLASRCDAVITGVGD